MVKRIFENNSLSPINQPTGKSPPTLVKHDGRNWIRFSSKEESCSKLTASFKTIGLVLACVFTSFIPLFFKRFRESLGDNFKEMTSGKCLVERFRPYKEEVEGSPEEKITQIFQNDTQKGQTKSPSKAREVNNSGKQNDFSLERIDFLLKKARHFLETFNSDTIHMKGYQDFDRKFLNAALSQLKESGEIADFAFDPVDGHPILKKNMAKPSPKKIPGLSAELEEKQKIFKEELKKRIETAFQVNPAASTAEIPLIADMSFGSMHLNTALEELVDNRIISTYTIDLDKFVISVTKFNGLEDFNDPILDKLADKFKLKTNHLQEAVKKLRRHLSNPLVNRPHPEVPDNIFYFYLGAITDKNKLGFKDLSEFEAALTYLLIQGEIQAFQYATSVFIIDLKNNSNDRKLYFGSNNPINTKENLNFS